MDSEIISVTIQSTILNGISSILAQALSIYKTKVSPSNFHMTRYNLSTDRFIEHNCYRIYQISMSPHSSSLSYTPYSSVHPTICGKNCSRTAFRRRSLQRQRQNRSRSQQRSKSLVPRHPTAKTMSSSA